MSKNKFILKVINYKEILINIIKKQNLMKKYYCKQIKKKKKNYIQNFTNTLLIDFYCYLYKLIIKIFLI